VARGVYVAVRVPTIYIDKNFDLAFDYGGKDYVHRIGSLFSYDWDHPDFLRLMEGATGNDMCLRIRAADIPGSSTAVDVVFREDVYGVTSPSIVFMRALGTYRR
jgi:hypothetical protein